MGKDTIRQLTFLLFFFLGINPVLVQAQNAYSHEGYYRWFDARVGLENTGLYEGILFKEQFRTINEKTPYLISRDFHDGTVIYKGQPYFGLKLKFNVFNDELLIKIQDRLGGNTLQLFKDKVAEFVLEGHRFINLGNALEERGISGFYEVSLETESFQLLTKHRLNQFKRKDRSSLYYEFLHGKKEHLLHYQGSYYTLDSKRDFLAIFPDLENQINTFYNRARVQRRADPHAFIISLMKRIGSLLPVTSSSNSR